MHTIRFFVYVIPISQPFASSRFLMAFTPRSARRIKGKENSSWLTWTKSQGPFGLWHCGGNLDRSADCYRRRWRKRGTEHTASERRVEIPAIRRIKQCRMTSSNLRSPDSASSCPSVCHLVWNLIKLTVVQTRSEVGFPASL